MLIFQLGNPCTGRTQLPCSQHHDLGINLGSSLLLSIYLPAWCQLKARTCPRHNSAPSPNWNLSLLLAEALRVCLLLTRAWGERGTGARRYSPFLSPSCHPHTRGRTDNPKQGLSLGTPVKETPPGTLFRSIEFGKFTEGSSHCFPTYTFRGRELGRKHLYQITWQYC